MRDRFGVYTDGSILLTVQKLITVLTFVGLAVCATRAEAQIFSWRDSNGNLVLSDRPLTPEAQSFPVAAAAAIRTTTPISPRLNNGYDDLIQHHAASHHVRPDLVRAVIQVESAFNRYAQSPKGAMGLMQLMPATAVELGVRDPYDPAQNIRGGVAYLRQLLDRYGNNEELALAAYNAGPRAVDQYGQTVPPYRETRSYVLRIKGMTAVSVATPKRTIYKTVDIVNGRAVPRYSNTKPSSGKYEVVPLRR